MKQFDQTGWFFVAPPASFWGRCRTDPLVTIINYSFFEISRLQFAVSGIGKPSVPRSDHRTAFWATGFLAESALFSTFVLCIQIPLGIRAGALHPRRAFWGGARHWQC